MERWFYSIDRLSQMILLIIPVIGWIIEISVRIFSVARKQSTMNVIGLVAFLLLGGFIIFNIIDVVYLFSNDQLVLTD